MAKRRGSKPSRRQKRDQKRKQARRVTLSPYQRAATGQIVACKINANWRKEGMVNIFVLRRAAAGLVLATFLVDLWCAGLKDAWGRLSMPREEFEEMIDYARETLDVAECDPDLARRLVGGAIRFANENGFRLPPRYQRWVNVLGGIGDVDEADLSDFRTKEGKLLWVGPMEQLRERLIGSSVEAFLARDDVDFISPTFPGADGSFVDEDAELDGEELAELEGVYEPDGLDEDDIEEVLDATGESMLNATRKWCFANGEAPHPRLAEAIDLMCESLLQAAFDRDDPEAPEESAGSAAATHIETFLSMADAQDSVELDEAIQQYQRFMDSFPSGEALADATVPKEAP